MNEKRGEREEEYPVEKKEEKKDGKKEEKIGEALMKVALGYQLAEVTEEYAEVDGELKLTKRKKTKKDVPPDLKAVQLLLSAEENGDITALSDAELEAERRRLLAALRETEQPKDAGKPGVSQKSTAKTAAKEESTAKGATPSKVRPKPRKRVVRKAKA